MRVLLVQSPYELPYAEHGLTERLGILYLAANLRARGIEVSVYDPTVRDATWTGRGFYHGEPADRIEKAIAAVSPDVVGISVQMKFAIGGARVVAAAAKKVSGGRIFTVAGGVYPSVYKESILSECSEIDFALRGESEISFPDFVSSLAAGKVECAKFDGLIWRDGDRIRVNEKRDFIADLDALPFPARDLVDTPTYMRNSTTLYGLGGRPALSLLSSRSCPNKCSYCNMWLVHGSRWRPRSAENVLDEIDEMVRKYKVRDVFVMDDNFTLDTGRVKQITEGIVRRGYSMRWNTPNGISAKNVDRELATLMRRSGCASVCLAIETGSESFRKRILGKPVSNDEIENAARVFSAAGIPVGGFVIVGMPGETEEIFCETLAFVSRLPLSFIVVSFACPFPGTRLHAELVERGVVLRDGQETPETYGFPMFTTEDFTEQDLLSRKVRLMRAFYGRNGLRIAFEMTTRWPYLWGFYLQRWKSGLSAIRRGGVRK